jgi:hypothetical protein
MAKSTRSKRPASRTFLSYLNPFSYIVKEIPFEDEDPKSPTAGKSVVNVFGVPLFTTDSAEEVPDVLATPSDKSGGGGSSNQSDGFLDKLNPFSR